MTVLLAIDTASGDIRRYDSTVPHGITHEAKLPVQPWNDILGSLEAFRCNPASVFVTDIHADWARRGYWRTPWRR